MQPEMRTLAGRWGQLRDAPGGRVHENSQPRVIGLNLG